MNTILKKTNICKPCLQTLSFYLSYKDIALRLPHKNWKSPNKLMLASLCAMTLLLTAAEAGSATKFIQSGFCQAFFLSSLRIPDADQARHLSLQHTPLFAAENTVGGPETSAKTKTHLRE